ncbi:uncharacterized protein LOC143941229 [Lithobates pipiens]
MLEQAGDLVKRLEIEYVTGPTDSAREAWMVAQDSLDRLRSSTTERRRFFTKLAFYEEGEQTGRLLARIAKAQQMSPAIGAIRAKNGKVVNSQEIIISELADFYQDLYRSRETYSDDDLQSYLATINLPRLSEEAMRHLDALITLEELMAAAGSFPTCKAPGTDGIPMERCKDVKILAKVLALRVNGIVSTIIHQDQAGFMPHKSTATNLRRLFLNMQLQADNGESRALLSLDANKAFDSIGWRYLWVVLELYVFRFREVDVREASNSKTTDQPLLQEVLNAITSDSGIERKSPVPAVSQKAEATIEHQDILDWQYNAELMKELEKYLCEDPSDASFKEVEVREESDFKTTDQPLLQEVLNIITSDSVSQKEEATIEHQDILDWQYTAELMKELEKYIYEDPSNASFKEVEVGEASDIKTETYLQELRNDIILDCGIERKSSVPAVSQKAEATIEQQDIWQYTTEVVKELEKYLCEDSSDSRFREVDVRKASNSKTTDQPLLQEVLNAITSDSGIERKSPVPAVSQKAEATIEHQDILDWQYNAELMKELEKYLCEDPSDASFKEVEVREESDFKTTDQPLLQEVLNIITSDSVSQKEEATIEHQDILDWQYTAELMKELEKYIYEDPSNASFKEVEVGEASDIKTETYLQELRNDIILDCGIERKSSVPAVSQKAEATIEQQDIWQYTTEVVKELEKYLCEDSSDSRFREVEVGEASHFKTADQLLLQEVRNDMTSQSDLERKSPVPTVKYPEIKMEEASCFTTKEWEPTSVSEYEVFYLIDKKLKEVEVKEALYFKTAGQLLLQEVRNDIISDSGIERNQPTNTSEIEDTHQGKEHVKCLL